MHLIKKCICPFLFLLLLYSKFFYSFSLINIYILIYNELNYNLITTITPLVTYPSWLISIRAKAFSFLVLSPEKLKKFNGTINYIKQGRIYRGQASSWIRVNHGSGGGGIKKSSPPFLRTQYFTAFNFKYQDKIELFVPLREILYF